MASGPTLRPRPQVVQRQVDNASQFLRNLRRNHRNDRGNTWTSNFVALELNDGTIVTAFNVGCGGSHSEAVMRGIMAGANNRSILTAFSDRSMCNDCQGHFSSFLRGHGFGGLEELTVYYIVGASEGNANHRQTQIRNWWMG